jgi:hypothetical protein
MEPLKTLKGSRIGYSKFGVGKQVGSKIYFHKSVWDKIIPEDIWNKALVIMDSDKVHEELWNDREIKEWEYGTICYDLKNPTVIRFDDNQEMFDVQSEPTVGYMMFVDTANESIYIKWNQQIYHHKWLFVKPDYEGFNVQKSYEWSEEWLSKLPEVASGYRHKWNEQLKKYNIRRK